MAWNKCSEKLPEVGMLIVTKFLNEYYEAGIVVLQHNNFFYLSTGDETNTYTYFNGLEWKEVQKD